MKKVMVVYGTRPEAVKVAPLIRELHRSEQLSPIVISTGQHRDMLEQINAWFGIQPDIDLAILRHGQTLTQLASRILDRLPPILDRYEPDAVVVQGDTSTVAMAAVASFYSKIPVVHLEAGLRSGSIHSPFPEEGNRKLAAQLAALHLAPTREARSNLVREGVARGSIAVVGNTVIDALNWSTEHPVHFSDARLRKASDAGQRCILVTAHRRENWGRPMSRIATAVRVLAQRYPDRLVILPAHRNPAVRNTLHSVLNGLENVYLTDPLDYPDFVHAQKWADVILTDSGGVQEEAPSLGKPVLVLRENTERPEAVAAGTVRLVGTDIDRIVDETTALLENKELYRRMSSRINPYGDGRAAQRSVAAISQLLGIDASFTEFGDPA